MSLLLTNPTMTSVFAIVVLFAEVIAAVTFLKAAVLGCDQCNVFSVSS